MLGALFWKSTFVTFKTTQGRSPFTVFTVALLLHWPQHRSTLGTIFDFFPVANYLKDYEDLVEDFRDATNTVAFISLAEDIVNKMFLALKS
jgi:hypothetical protein